MALHDKRNLALAIVFSFVAELSETPVGGADAHAQQSVAAPVTASQEAERQKILASERWKQAQRKFNDWLAIQTAYSAEQAAALKTELDGRVAKASPDELNVILTEMEDRLAVLMSPEAEDTRQWIAGILAVARNPESQLGGPLPDVANMSASEIRDELTRFQRLRASRQQVQSSFDRTREQQVHSARASHAAQRTARADAPPRTAATIIEPQRSPYSLHRGTGEPVSGPPVYRSGPWGEPVRWNPLYDWRPERWGWGS